MEWFGPNEILEKLDNGRLSSKGNKRVKQNRSGNAIEMTVNITWLAAASHCCRRSGSFPLLTHQTWSSEFGVTLVAL